MYGPGHCKGIRHEDSSAAKKKKKKRQWRQRAKQKANKGTSTNTIVETIPIIVVAVERRTAVIHPKECLKGADNDVDEQNKQTRQQREMMGLATLQGESWSILSATAISRTALSSSFSKISYLQLPSLSRPIKQTNNNNKKLRLTTPTTVQ